MRIGYARSSDSIGVLSVLLIPTCTAARPGAARARALSAAERLVERPAGAAEGDVVHRPLPLRRHVDAGVAERGEDRVGDALRHLHVARGHRGRPRGVRPRSRSGSTSSIARAMPSFVGTSSSSSVRSTNTAAARVTASGQFTLPAHLRRRAGEVEHAACRRAPRARPRPARRRRSRRRPRARRSRGRAGRLERRERAPARGARRSRAARRTPRRARAAPARAASARQPVAPAAHAASCAREIAAPLVRRAHVGEHQRAGRPRPVAPRAHEAHRRNDRVLPAPAPWRPAACCPGLMPPTSA